MTEWLLHKRGQSKLLNIEYGCVQSPIGYTKALIQADNIDNSTLIYLCLFSVTGVKQTSSVLHWKWRMSLKRNAKDKIGNINSALVGTCKQSLLLLWLLILFLNAHFIQIILFYPNYCIWIDFYFIPYLF